VNCRAVLTLVLTAVSLAAAINPVTARPRDPESEAPRRPIVVRVYNTARVSSDTLRAAETNAEYVFSRAGVRTQWIDCSATTGPPVVSNICHQPLSSAEVVVRLIRKADAPKTHFDGEVLGFASAVGSERGAYTTVFCDAVAAAESSESGLRLSLGHAIAHELGHLFLRSNEHSTTGVMRATWGQHDRLLAASNRVLFLPDQKKRIQAEVRSRTGESAGADASRLPRTTEAEAALSIYRSP